MSELEWLKQDWMIITMDSQKFIDDVVNSYNKHRANKITETKVSVLQSSLYKGKYQVFFEHTVNGLPCFISETVSEYGGGFIDWFDI